MSDYPTVAFNLGVGYIDDMKVNALEREVAALQKSQQQLEQNVAALNAGIAKRDAFISKRAANSPMYVAEDGTIKFNWDVYGAEPYNYGVKSSSFIPFVCRCYSRSGSDRPAKILIHTSSNVQVFSIVFMAYGDRTFSYGQATMQASSSYNAAAWSGQAQNVESFRNGIVITPYDSQGYQMTALDPNDISFYLDWN